MRVVSACLQDTTWRMKLKSTDPDCSAYRVGVLISAPESTRFQQSSAQLTDFESVVLRDFAETPTGLAVAQVFCHKCRVKKKSCLSYDLAVE